METENIKRNSEMHNYETKNFELYNRKLDINLTRYGLILTA